MKQIEVVAAIIRKAAIEQEQSDARINSAEREQARPKVNLPAGLCIDLGEVGQMADVFINGQHVDFLWKAPYKVNFEGQLKPGKNTIEVKVVNTWVNRLIGDGQPNVEGHSFTPVAFYGVKSLSQNMGTLIPSGLMGPVRLEIYFPKNLVSR